jgi:predicted acylesterase/phospholipase RssA
MPTRIRPVHVTRIAPSPRVVTPATRINDFAGQLHLPVNPIDGVLQGGATLGAAYLGGLALLEQNRLWFKRIAGNSSGAITAAMIAAGYRGPEIEWLCSAFTPTPPRPAGVPASLSPIDFWAFLDFPTLNSIGTAARRKTLLWRALKGTVIDNILNTNIPVPTQAQVVDAAVNGLKASPAVGPAVTPIEAQVRSVLNSVLAFLPNAQPKIGDFQLFDTEPLRMAFADAAWAAIASVNPLLIVHTQLWHEGSMFEGTKFLQIMRSMLGAKVHPNNPSLRVDFKQLPIPLAVIGANIETGHMEVYSSGRTPTMEVAEAVRRSMSLPLIFQPRGTTVVDGGLCSNFPAWLFTAAGDEHWPASSIDLQRPIVGLALNASKEAPPRWNAAPGKFSLTDNPPPPHVDLKDVLIPSVIAIMKNAGIYVPSVAFPETALQNDLMDFKALDVAVGSAVMYQEEVVRALMTRALFPTRRYFDVEIPLLGFHAFDFGINSDVADLASIAERGWFATKEALAGNPTSGAPLLTNPDALQNPFR